MLSCASLSHVSARAVPLLSTNMADQELAEQRTQVEILQNGDSHEPQDETDHAEDASKKKKKKKKKSKAAVVGKETQVIEQAVFANYRPAPLLT